MVLFVIIDIIIDYCTLNSSRNERFHLFLCNERRPTVTESDVEKAYVSHIREGVWNDSVWWEETTLIKSRFQHYAAPTRV